MVFSESGGTGLLFIGHRVGFAARAHEYQAESDQVGLFVSIIIFNRWQHYAGLALPWARSWHRLGLI